MGIGDHGNKVGRPTDLNEYLEDAIVELVAEGISYRRISKILKIHKSYITRWQHMFPEFKVRIQRALDDYTCGRVERSQRRSAMGYRYTETTREISETPGPDGEAVMVVTKKVSKHVQGSTAAQQHILHNLNPKRWKQIRHLQHGGVVGLIDPVKAMEARQEEFVDAEFEEVQPKQLEEGKND